MNNILYTIILLHDILSHKIMKKLCDIMKLRKTKSFHGLLIYLQRHLSGPRLILNDLIRLVLFGK